jgi:superfamily II DNA or RNA helicase
MDDEKFKKEVFEDFAKPDTEINGLIATDILTKGFDCPDVMIGVSARPFSKSLSSHIQQLGRVMRGSKGKEHALWLCHSGNYLRFRADWEDIYANGVHELDDGKEKVKKELTKKEKEASKCPRCNALWAGGDTCHACGYVREKKNKVIDVSGELKELEGAMGGVSKQDFWSMMQYYKKHHGWSDGRMAHNYREKFGVWPRMLDASIVKEPSAEVKKFVDKKLKAYIMSIRKGKR